MSATLEQIDRLSHQAAELSRQRRLLEAQALAAEAVELARRQAGEDSAEHAAALSSLADLQQVAGDHAAAEPLLRQAIDIRRRALGEGHPDYAAALNNLAEWHLDRGEAA